MQGYTVDVLVEGCHIPHGGGEGNDLDIVDVGGIQSTCVQRTRVSFTIDPHPQSVSVATFDGDAERFAVQHSKPAFVRLPRGIWLSMFS